MHSQHIGLGSRDRADSHIIGTLNHTYVVDLIWQAHLEGREHGFKARNILLHSELPALWAAQQKINDWFVDWAARSGASIRRA